MRPPKEGRAGRLGVHRTGERVLLSVMLSMRESHEDRLALGRDLIARVLGAPLLIVAEGVRASVCEAVAAGLIALRIWRCMASIVLVV